MRNPGVRQGRKAGSIKDRGAFSRLDWKKGGGLLPAVIQHADNHAVLMQGYMSREALKKTLSTGKVWFWSRTKKRLWMKGEQSGNILELVEIKPDCDQDALLVRALPSGPTCHTGAFSCFGVKEPLSHVLTELFRVIEGRRKTRPPGSYTARLFQKGLPHICGKVKEEALEVIRAARHETSGRLVEESVDLLYHLLVLLAEKHVALNRIFQEVKRRRQ